MLLWRSHCPRLHRRGRPAQHLGLDPATAACIKAAQHWPLLSATQGSSCSGGKGCRSSLHKVIAQVKAAWRPLRILEVDEGHAITWCAGQVGVSTDLKSVEAASLSVKQLKEQGCSHKTISASAQANTRAPAAPAASSPLSSTGTRMLPLRRSLCANTVGEPVAAAAACNAVPGPAGSAQASGTRRQEALARGVGRRLAGACKSCIPRMPATQACLACSAISSAFIRPKLNVRKTACF